MGDGGRKRADWDDEYGDGFPILDPQQDQHEQLDEL